MGNLHVFVYNYDDDKDDDRDENEDDDEDDNKDDGIDYDISSSSSFSVDTKLNFFVYSLILRLCIRC